jgi:hypothetical protein
MSLNGKINRQDSHSAIIDSWRQRSLVKPLLQRLDLPH